MKPIPLFIFAVFVAGLINPLSTQSTNTTAPAEEDIDTPNNTITTAPETVPETEAVNTTTESPDENTTSSMNTTEAPFESDEDEEDDFLEVHPLSPKCLNLYSECTQSEATVEMENYKYCDAYHKVQNCTKHNRTDDDNSTLTCTEDELTKLGILNCGPVRTLDKANNGSSTYNVSDACLAKITECMSEGPGLLELGTVYHFNNYFCDNGLASKPCMVDKEKDPTCSEKEYEAFYEASKCSSACALISSMSVICLLLALHRLLG